MMEFEEFEGLGDDTQTIEVLDDKEEDDGSLKPAAASGPSKVLGSLIRIKIYSSKPFTKSSRTI
jgi:hypothetical protein